MRTKLMLSMTAGLAVILSQGVSHQAWAGTGTALTGQVSSAEEGKMEGVVVSARKVGSTVMVSVTTDAQGRYSFPENRLEPGQYTLAIRAVGYDMAAATTAAVKLESTATADIKLQKTKNLASQLTNAEWMMSIPGTDDQKALLLNCTSCHTVDRIVRPTHNSDELTQVLARMAGSGQGITPSQPRPMQDQVRAGPPGPDRTAAGDV